MANPSFLNERPSDAMEQIQTERLLPLYHQIAKKSMYLLRSTSRTGTIYT